MRFRDYLRHVELFSEVSPPSSSPMAPPAGNLPGMPPSSNPLNGLGAAPANPPMSSPPGGSMMGGGGGMPPAMPPGSPGAPPTGQAAEPLKLKSFDVWSVLEKILHHKEIKDDRKPPETPQAPPPDPNMAPGQDASQQPPTGSDPSAMGSPPTNPSPQMPPGM